MQSILVIRLYFSLKALHVSDCISPSSGVTSISCTSHLVYASTIRLAYTKCDVLTYLLTYSMEQSPS